MATNETASLVYMLYAKTPQIYLLTLFGVLSSAWCLEYPPEWAHF